MAVVDHHRRAPLWVDWDIIDVIVSGKSAIDLPRLNVGSLEAADDFIRAYGYDLSNPNDAKEVAAILKQAKDFVNNVLAPDPEHKSPPVKMPPEIENETDVRKLMLMSSVRTGPTQRWACAILRLMHTITYVNNDFATYFFPQIQRQIVERIKSFVYEAPNGDVYLGKDEKGIKLYTLEIKSRKPFESSVLKLLHKVENVGADLFDRIGVRFVTETKLDALLALKYMAEENVIVFANVKPTRSRNTLVNMTFLRQEFDKLLPLYNRGELKLDELRQLAHMAVESERARPHIRPEELHERNAFSSTAYSSIQFTVRQLMRVKLPQVDPEIEIPEHDRLPDRELRFFFPYEVQILDRRSYLESRKGRASHEEYKRQQLIVARKRVFRGLL